METSEAISGIVEHFYSTGGQVVDADQVVDDSGLETDGVLEDSVHQGVRRIGTDDIHLVPILKKVLALQNFRRGLVGRRELPVVVARVLERVQPVVFWFGLHHIDGLQGQLRWSEKHVVRVLPFLDGMRRFGGHSVDKSRS